MRIYRGCRPWMDAHWLRGAARDEKQYFRRERPPHHHRHHQRREKEGPRYIILSSWMPLSSLEQETTRHNTVHRGQLVITVAAEKGQRYRNIIVAVSSLTPQKKQKFNRGRFSDFVIGKKASLYVPSHLRYLDDPKIYLPCQFAIHISLAACSLQLAMHEDRRGTLVLTSKVQGSQDSRKGRGPSPDTFLSLPNKNKNSKGGIIERCKKPLQKEKKVPHPQYPDIPYLFP